MKSQIVTSGDATYDTICVVNKTRVRPFCLCVSTVAFLRLLNSNDAALMSGIQVASLYGPFRSNNLALRAWPWGN